MYNLKAQSINHFRVANEENDDEDSVMGRFVRDCLAAFKKTIQPTIEHYADLPTQCVQIAFTSIDTSSSSSTDTNEEENSGISMSVECIPAQAAAEQCSIMIVPKRVLSTLQRKPFLGLHYAFLMTHPLFGKKTSANVGYSTNPMYDVHLHNTLAINDRTTSAAAPHWILDIVLGPFISVELAIECTKEWVTHTRGKKSKRKKAYFLSRIYDVPLYAAATKPTVTLRDYLAENAPPNYMECYEKMLNSPHAYIHQPKSNKRQKKKKPCSITHVSI